MTGHCVTKLCVIMCCFIVCAPDATPPHADETGNVQAEIQQLRRDFESFKHSHEKRLADLTAELDEEKKIRLTLQVEMERLKKRLAE